MARRITGSSVSKGDLVRRKFTQLLFEYDPRNIHAERVNKNEEIGIVVSTIQPYDRSTSEGDCYVFWNRTKTVVQESSHTLRVLSQADKKSG